MMFTTAHLMFAFIVAQLLGAPNEPITMFVYYGAASLIDGDLILPSLARRLKLREGSFHYKAFNVTNHRLLPTHMPTFWIVFTPLMLFGNPLVAYFFVAVFGHLLLDAIDYGVRLSPWSLRTYGLKLLVVEDGRPLSYYLRRYFTSVPMLACEGILASIAIAFAFVV